MSISTSARFGMFGSPGWPGSWRGLIFPRPEPRAAVALAPLSPRGRGVGGEKHPPTPHPSPPRGEGSKTLPPLGLPPQPAAPPPVSLVVAPFLALPYPPPRLSLQPPRGAL